jgi:hypothetical protein
MKPRMMPPLQLPIQRTASGKPAATAGGADLLGSPTPADGASPSIIGFGLPFADDGALTPSFVFPPLPFADDGAE